MKTKRNATYDLIKDATRNLIGKKPQNYSINSDRFQSKNKNEQEFAANRNAQSMKLLKDIVRTINSAVKYCNTAHK